MQWIVPIITAAAAMLAAIFSGLTWLENWRARTRVVEPTITSTISLSPEMEEMWAVQIHIVNREDAPLLIESIVLKTPRTGSIYSQEQCTEPDGAGGWDVKTQRPDLSDVRTLPMNVQLMAKGTPARSWESGPSAAERYLTVYLHLPKTSFIHRQASITLVMNMGSGSPRMSRIKSTLNMTAIDKPTTEMQSIKS